jgi:hypothetical protein
MVDNMGSDGIRQTFLDLHAGVEYLSTQYRQTLLAPEGAAPGLPTVANIEAFLDHLKDCERYLKDVHDQLGRELKSQGYTWQDIANIFDIGSRQGAQQAFCKKPPKSPPRPADAGTI